MSLPPLTLNAWLRYELIRRALDAMGDVRSVLEIGAGEGAMGTRLASRYSYVGIEPDGVSRRLAQERLDRLGSGAALQADLSALDPDTRFDLVCAFEVIEHIEDDADALRTWGERVRPGGWVLLSTPQHPTRFDAGDRLAGHFRRYERRELASLLRSTGFDAERVWSYGFPLGYALETARNLLARRRESRLGSIAERTAASGRYLQPPDWLGSLTQALSAPFRLAQRPFIETELGPGLVAWARRSSAPRGRSSRNGRSVAEAQPHPAGDDHHGVGGHQDQPLGHRSGDDVAAGNGESDGDQEDGLADSDA
jgi:SAM-dependent methyltransferase